VGVRTAEPSGVGSSHRRNTPEQQEVFSFSEKAFRMEMSTPEARSIDQIRHRSHSEHIAACSGTLRVYRRMDNIPAETIRTRRQNDASHIPVLEQHTSSIYYWNACRIG